MKLYPQNCCRLCPKSFCCETCRAQHEEQVHAVNPDCEICIYGRTTVKKASVSLLNHIRTTHWPLHCVFCKKVFTSLDELIPHDTCPLQLKNFKMEGTPKTPVTASLDESPEVTPFYKCVKIQQLGPSSIAMTATSTPLVRKEEGNSVDKLTPINQSEISCPHKSNLKLTGSSNLSDSKKSDRRVTFSETPSVSEPFKKFKLLPLTKQIDEREEETVDDSTDESYVSIEEYKTAPSTSTIFEDKDNSDSEIVILDRCGSGGTSIWESALTKLDFNSSTTLPITQTTNHFNVSLQINMFNKPTDNSALNSSDEQSSLNKSTNLWSSMTNMVKSVVSNLSMTAQNSFSSVSLKRSQPEPDGADVPSLKRLKLTEIKCRRPIREMNPSYQVHVGRPRYVDKATQTDDCWM